MKSRKPDSPPKAKAKTAKAAKAAPSTLPPATKPRKRALSGGTEAGAVVKAKAAPVPTVPAKDVPATAPVQVGSAPKREQAPALGANQVLKKQSPSEVGTARRAVRGRLGEATLPKPDLRSPALQEVAAVGPGKTATASMAPVKAVPATTAPVKAASGPKREQAPALQKAARAAAVKPKTSAEPSRLRIPPVLLEGDQAARSPASGPGRRYVLGPTPPPAMLAPAGAELPESYGTQQLFLAARDPRWLYAHWDFTAGQLKKYNALSADGHLLLRLYRDTPAGPPLLQIHLHPESRHWFVPAPHAGAKYAATLGYYNAAKEWTELARSAATLTPPDSVAEDTSVRFATIPLDVPFAQLLASVQAAVRENVPLAEAVQELRAQGFASLPEPEQIPGPWTAAQEQALAAVVLLDPARRIWIGSLEVTELIRRQLEHGVSSVGAAQLGRPSSPAAAFGAVSSPSGRRERQRGFWFNVNAELIVYGATEPDAAVTIGGRQIQLRRDGSFSLRFALPDGQYELPVAARSADGEETRQAELKFSRASQYQGAVAAHPQDVKLQPPSASVVS